MIGAQRLENAPLTLTPSDGAREKRLRAALALSDPGFKAIR
jgi:hypothetical protein